MTCGVIVPRNQCPDAPDDSRPPGDLISVGGWVSWPSFLQSRHQIQIKREPPTNPHLAQPNPRDRYRQARYHNVLKPHSKCRQIFAFASINARQRAALPSACVDDKTVVDTHRPQAPVRSTGLCCCRSWRAEHFESGFQLAECMGKHAVLLLHFHAGGQRHRR